MHQINPTLAPKPNILTFKNSPVKHHETISQQSIYQTPKKDLSQSSNRLRSEIRQRLFSKKYKLPLNQFQPQQQQTQVRKIEESEEKQKHSLRQIVIELQSQQNEGYYMFKDWINLNQCLFKDVESKYYENLWKILRLINYGEIAIPTGLIFDLIAQLSNNKMSSNKQEINIIQIINQFLNDNNIQNSYQSFQQLQYYIPLPKIIKGYRLQKQQAQTSNAPCNTEVFQNLYQDSKLRKLKQTVKVLTTQKKQIEGCTFAPLIKPYKTAEKSSRKIRNCDSVTKNIFQTDRQQVQEQFSHVVKARPIDPRIYKTKLENVKGLKEHVNRNVDSYMQKLRIKRSMQKPVIIKKN